MGVGSALPGSSGAGPLGSSGVPTFAWQAAAAVLLCLHITNHIALTAQYMQIVTGVVLGVEFSKHDNTLPNNVAVGVLVSPVNLPRPTQAFTGKP